MSAMASQITSVSIVCSIVGPGADQRKHQSSASLVFAWGIHRWPMSSPHKKPGIAENVSIWWRHRDLLHMAFWMESFDLPNPLHWRHMGALTSRVTGNSTDCSAAPSGKQVRRQIVHITGPLWGESTSCSPNKGPAMWKVYYFDRNYSEIHFWEQAIFLMDYFINAYASLDFTHVC